MTSASVRLARSEKKTETGRQTSESRDRQQRKSVCHAHTRTRISAWGGGPGGPVKHGQRSRRHQERRYLPPQPGRGNRWRERRSLKKGRKSVGGTGLRRESRRNPQAAGSESKVGRLTPIIAVRSPFVQVSFLANHLAPVICDLSSPRLAHCNSAMSSSHDSASRVYHTSFR